VLPSAIPVARRKRKILNTEAVVQAVAMPAFAQMVPQFNSVRQVAWQLYNDLVQEGMLTENGAPAKGCRGCRGGTLMRRYHVIVRAFVRKCVEAAEKDPEALQAVKNFFNTNQIIVQDPDTRELFRL
jgi:hypothetical protein